MRITKAATLIAVLSLAATAAACGSSDEGGGGEGPVPISWWTWDANQAVSYQKCADAFNESNADIEVTVSNYGWNDYWTKIAAGFVSDTAPDTFMDHTSYYPQFASKGQLMPLEDRVEEAGIDLGLYGDAVESFTYSDGSLYAIPNDTATIAFYYNKGLVEEAGLTEADLKDMTWNYDDGGTFLKVIKRLSVDSNGVRGDEPGFDPESVVQWGMGPMAHSFTNGQNTWSQFAGSLGWTLGDKPNYPTEYRYSDPEFKKTLNWLRDLSKEGFSPAQGEFDTSAVQDQIGSSKIAMVYDPTSDIVAMHSISGADVGMAASVVGPKGRSSLVNSNSDSISASTKYPEEAWKWVEYLTSDACQSLAGADATFLPVLASAAAKTYESLEAQGIDTTTLKAIYDEAAFFTSPVSLGGTDMDAELTPLWEQYFAWQVDDEVFDQMTELSREVLANAAAG
jgi:multiple sugar transport system substrate-binding protein